MRLVATSIVLASALISSAHAEGDSLEDLLGPRAVALGEAMRGEATGATAIGLNPAGLPLNRELVFEGGYGYRLADQASLIGVSACDSTSPVPGCFYYNYAGSNPELDGMTMRRRTHVAGMALAYPITPHVFLGTNLKYFHFSSDVMGEPKASGFVTDVGATLRLTPLVNIGLAGYNLLGASSVEFPRAAGGGVTAHPIPILGFSFDARWKLESNDHSARYGGGAELFLRRSNGQTGFPIRVGALHDSGLGATYLSGGVGLATMKLAVDIAARREISGGHETLLMASLRFFGPRQRTAGLGSESQ